MPPVALKVALRDADFVIISIQPGPLEMMAEEIANYPTNHLPINAGWELFNKMLQISLKYLPSRALI